MTPHITKNALALAGSEEKVVGKPNGEDAVVPASELHCPMLDED